MHIGRTIRCQGTKKLFQIQRASTRSGLSSLSKLDDRWSRAVSSRKVCWRSQGPGTRRTHGPPRAVKRDRPQTRSVWDSGKLARSWTWLWTCLRPKAGTITGHCQVSCLQQTPDDKTRFSVDKSRTRHDAWRKASGALATLSNQRGAPAEPVPRLWFWVRSTYVVSRSCAKVHQIIPSEDCQIQICTSTQYDRSRALPCRMLA